MRAKTEKKERGQGERMREKGRKIGIKSFFKYMSMGFFDAADTFLV